MVNSDFVLDDYIGKIPGFPKAGITFYDISPVLEDAVLLKKIIDSVCELAKPYRPDIIAGIDARGFLFATPVAYHLGCGSVMVRKSNKLPGEVITQSYDLEYGTAELSLQVDRKLTGKRVLLADDLIATGGSLNAAEKLINQSGGIVCGAICLIELTGLNGRAKLDCPVESVQQYEF